MYVHSKCSSQSRGSRCKDGKQNSSQMNRKGSTQLKQCKIHEAEVDKDRKSNQEPTQRKQLHASKEPGSPLESLSPL